MFWTTFYFCKRAFRHVQYFTLNLKNTIFSRLLSIMYSIVDFTFTLYLQENIDIQHTLYSNHAALQKTFWIRGQTLIVIVAPPKTLRFWPSTISKCSKTFCSTKNIKLTTYYCLEDHWVRVYVGFSYAGKVVKLCLSQLHVSRQSLMFLRCVKSCCTFSGAAPRSNSDMIHKRFSQSLTPIIFLKICAALCVKWVKL